MSNAPNWLGVYTLAAKETRRFIVVWVQALLGPVITTLLFLIIFAVVLRDRAISIPNTSYLEFLAPGLIMMAILQNSFANSSTSILISKVNGSIFDVLTAPLAPFELVLGYTIGAILRGVIVGLILVAVLGPFGLLPFEQIGNIVFFALGGALLFSMLGVVGGILAEKMEHVAFLSNIVIVPLTILSGTFFSIHLLPDWLKSLSAGNPIFYLIDGFRSGFVGAAEGSLFAGGVITVSASAGLFALCTFLFSRGYKLKA